MASLPSSKLMWGAFSLICGLTCLLVGNSIFHANSVGGPAFGSMIMLLAAVMLISGLIGLFPYHPRYLMLVPHTGTVRKVQRWMLDGSVGSINATEVAFYLRGEPMAYVTSDIRFSGLKPGDVVSIRRQAVWNYAGEDTWAVEYLGVRRPRVR